MLLGEIICKHLYETWYPEAWTPVLEPTVSVTMPEDAVPGIRCNFERGFLGSRLWQVLLLLKKKKKLQTSVFGFTFSKQL